jgi:hypothetical protein
MVGGKLSVLRLRYHFKSTKYFYFKGIVHSIVTSCGGREGSFLQRQDYKGKLQFSA